MSLKDKLSKVDLHKTREASAEWVRNELPQTLGETWRLKLRWSYIASAVMIAIGAIINCFMPNGWTVWPFVMAGGIMAMIHEAAERNGEGIPPLHVYAFLGGTIAIWIVVMAILSVTNPLILLAGLIGLGYYCGRAYLRQREKMKLIESRRADGRCIHCGEIVEDPQLCFCPNCGEEPDPSSIQLQRVKAMVTAANQSARARAVIKGESASAVASRKEKALLAARARHSTARKK